ncbi:MAG: phosphoribosylglycinamide formyltransferase [Candidatus Sumerlaea chitinivorans]|nr:phosphoribosylglycinamide formyltransferase [Candidatus Sumerlaea chitinivorans]
MEVKPIPLGVLASGRGSNFEAILRKQSYGYFARAQVACLIVNKAEAGAIAIAEQYGVPHHVVLQREFPSKDAYEAEIVRLLKSYGVEYVILAGYMRIVGHTLLEAYPQRILNIHPALLPSFPGLHAQRQALEYGVKISGCTVHFVDAGVDTGPIIVQRAVPVLPGDTEETLSARILEQEHIAYSEAIKMVTEEPWEIRGRVVHFPQREPKESEGKRA